MRILQRRADDAILHHQLQRLSQPGGQRATLLDGLQIRAAHRPGRERRGQPIGAGHGILHGQIYPDSTDGRHRVGGIADAQQPRPPPLM